MEKLLYWKRLKEIVEAHTIVIERPKGTAHPRYPQMVYPVDYGFLENTTTIDGGGIDIFVGSSLDNSIQGVINTVDILKNDAEIKIMYNCTDDEIQDALQFLSSEYMSAIFVKKE